MTSIKPPSSGSTGPHTPPDRTDTSSGVSHGSQQTDSAASSSFQRSLEQAREAHQVSPTSSSTGTSGADRIAHLAQSVEGGSLSLEQAVDELLGQTLARAEKHLSAEQRAELSDLLRNALSSDPTLSSWRGERP
jgi:hypothetical protein